MDAFEWQLSIGNRIRCGELEIYDITGTGLTGWGDGTVTPSIDSITEAKAKIIMSDGAYWTGSIKSTVPQFPNINGVPFVINASVLGQRPPDGRVTIEAYVIGNYNGTEGLLAKTTTTGYVFCNAACCVVNLQKKAKGYEDPCSSKEWKAYLVARELLKSLEHEVFCKKFDKADVILADIKQICANNNANCDC